MGKIYDELLKFKNKYHGGIGWRLKSHSNCLEEYIDSDEEIKYVFYGQKNDSIAELFNTFVVVLTSKRLLLGHKGLLFGSFMYTITPDLYNDMEIYKGLIWGKIIIDTVKEEVILTNLPKNSLDDIETNISNFMMNAKKDYKDE